MLTLTPTATIDAAPENGLEVFAVIGGHKVYLPSDAHYVMQDRRGLWFYSKRKPRPKEGDWTPNKVGISCKNNEGFVRALKTDIELPWLETCQRTVRVLSDVKNGRRLAVE